MNFTTGNLYLHQFGDSFTLVECKGMVNEFSFIGLILESDIEGFKDHVGSNVMLYFKDFQLLTEAL